MPDPVIKVGDRIRLCPDLPEMVILEVDRSGDEVEIVCGYPERDEDPEEPA